MKNLYLVLWLVSTGVMSESYHCVSHPSWPDDRTFSAVIDINQSAQGIQAQLLDLTLSEEWPLLPRCDSPQMGMNLSAVKEKDEVKLFLKDAKTCGFMFYISTNEVNPSLLSPQKSEKVFGEAPYLAQCKIKK